MKLSLPIAKQQIQELLVYLETEWNHKVKKNFLKKLKDKFGQLQLFPLSAPESKQMKGLHKAVIHKHVSLIYRVDTTSIIIIAVVDNRSNQKK